MILVRSPIKKKLGAEILKHRNQDRFVVREFHRRYVAYIDLIIHTVYFRPNFSFNQNYYAIFGMATILVTVTVLLKGIIK